MRPMLAALVCATLAAAPLHAEPAPAPAAAPAQVVIDHTVTSIDGKPVNLSDYRGKALLIVNTASRCGFTPQYEDLERLYNTYKDRGLVVLGFPSNDFGGQEPGSEAEIKTFCQTTYGVTFPMMAKVHAKGPEIAPVYKALSEQGPDALRGEVKWNFTKFLIDPQGHIVARFESRTKPGDTSMIEAIEKALPVAQ